ncbi:MAG: DNA-protecting protein DprA [Gammaproteobacteria bacterium]|nr:MAG: DNA-protecting protein DprA [Gammaproteobacteria bacterium]
MNQTVKTSTENWLALKLVSRLAVHKKLLLVETFKLKGLFLQTEQMLLSSGLSIKQCQQIISPDWHKITQIINQAQQCNGEILTFDHANYPQLLKQIYDPPLILFTKGNQALLNKPQLAMVGSRSATITGIEFAKYIASNLVQQGIVITSGLALGIDAAAHCGALNNNNSTIAVVATGLDSVYPSRHRQLAKNIIVQGGLIISEFLPGTKAKAGHFPRRNRLISGLSLGVLVVEAEIKSGSLITARCALEQNREVFAVPGSVNNPKSKGCHWLIKQGAKLIDDLADIIEELDLSPLSGLKQYDDKKLQQNSPQDLFIDPLLASVDYETTPVDIVVSRSKLSIEEVLTRLTILELNNLVSAVPGGYVRLK